MSKDTNKRYKKVQIKNQGITLIALVITIIVILILAGVSINTLFGDNGLITKAQEAADANTSAGAYDKVETETFASYNNSGELDESTLRENLKRAGGTATNGGDLETESTTGFPIVVKMDGFLFAIGENGDVTRMTVGEWIQTANKIITIEEETGEIKTVEVGDTITGYDPIDGASKTSEISNYNDNGYGNSDQTFSLEYNTPTNWIILGAEDGQLIITTKDVVLATTYGGCFYLKGAKGYANAIKELDKISKLYGQGKYADKEKTRSINVDDVNKVTRYDPMKGDADRMGPYGKGTIEQYKSEVEYSWDSSETEKKVKYTDKTITSITGTSNYKKFQYPEKDGSIGELKDGETKTFLSDYYYYYPESLSVSNTGTAGNVRRGLKEYNALFIGQPYLLGSQSVDLEKGNVYFSLRIIESGDYVDVGDLFSSSGRNQTEWRVRSPSCFPTTWD